MASGVKYDLTFTLSKFLDKHLVRVLLQTLREADIYDQTDILKAEYDIVSRTHMVDEAADLYGALVHCGYDFEEKDKKTEEYWDARRESVLTKLCTLSDDMKDFMDFLYSDAHTIDLIQYKYGGDLRGGGLGGHQEITSETLERFSNGKFNESHVQKLLEYATFLYEAGQYDSGIADLLKYYREFASSTEPRKCREAKWGQLAADIWRRDWSSAEDLVEDLFAGARTIKRAPGLGDLQETPLERITQRAWLLHWCLFIYFNNEEYFQLIEKFLMDAKNASAIRIVCPHLLRYLTVAHFTDIICHNSSHSSTLLDKLGETLEDMKYIYSDPVTETVRLYMIDSDFQGASEALKQSKEVMESDFFLRSLTIQWLANVRRLMFKKYARLCSTIDLAHLNTMLHFDVVPPNAGEGKDVEDWVANIIRRDKIDARIDLTNNLIHVRKGDVCVHQVVIDKMHTIVKTKTKNLIHTIKSNQILTT